MVVNDLFQYCFFGNYVLFLQKSQFNGKRVIYQENYAVYSLGRATIFFPQQQLKACLKCCKAEKTHDVIWCPNVKNLLFWIHWDLNVRSVPFLRFFLDFRTAKLATVASGRAFWSRSRPAGLSKSTTTGRKLHAMEANHKHSNFIITIW